LGGVEVGKEAEFFFKNIASIQKIQSQTFEKALTFSARNVGVFTLKSRRRKVFAKIA